jgi:hypothetical protein
MYVRPHTSNSTYQSKILRIQLTGEDSYQIAQMGVHGLRVEIVSDAPPPPDEPP